MAIEIIPKSEIRKPALVVKLPFFIGIFLLVLAVLGYFYLRNDIKNSSETLKNLENTILEKRTPEVENLEKEISSWRQKIEDFNFLFAGHRESSNLFNLLEKITHPKVWWTDFKFDPSLPNNLRLSGISQDFPALQQQLIIFGNESSIKSVILNKVSLLKGGTIEFELEISADPEILKPKSSPTI
jgi:Tfp pilus assembly protein PilN